MFGRTDGPEWARPALNFGARGRAVSLGVVAVLAPVGALAHRSHPAAGVTAAADPPIGRCAITATSDYAPTHLHVGDTVGVTVSLLSECGDTPVNMVLVIDAGASGQMTEDLLVWAEDIVDFSLSVMPLARVGVVTYSDRATAQCEITADGDVLRACIASIVTGEGFRLDLGLAEAADMFARHEPTDPELALVTRDVAIVLMARTPEPVCALSIEAARALQNDGILVWSIYPCSQCLGSPDFRDQVTCARRIATNPHYFMLGWEEFLARFEETTQPLQPLSTVISTTLPISVSRAALFDPMPDESDRTLTWSFATPVPNPVTVTYRVYAERAGTYSLGETWAELRFSGFGDSHAPGHGRPPLKFEPQMIHVTGSVWLPLLVNGR